MSGGVVDGSRNTDDGPPEDFTWSFIFGALGSAAIVTIIIVAYRCRAYRIRREQLAKELEQEQLFELKVAREMEADDAPDWVDPSRGAHRAGLGNDYYMSAYKKLLVEV